MTVSLLCYSDTILLTTTSRPKVTCVALYGSYPCPWFEVAGVKRLIQVDHLHPCQVPHRQNAEITPVGAFRRRWHPRRLGSAIITLLLELATFPLLTPNQTKPIIMSTTADLCPVYAPFFGAMGCTAAIVFTCIGAA